MSILYHKSAGGADLPMTRVCVAAVPSLGSWDKEKTGSVYWPVEEKSGEALTPEQLRASKRHKLTHGMEYLCRFFIHGKHSNTYVWCWPTEYFEMREQRLLDVLRAKTHHILQSGDETSIKSHASDVRDVATILPGSHWDPINHVYGYKNPYGRAKTIDREREQLVVDGNVTNRGIVVKQFTRTISSALELMRGTAVKGSEFRSLCSDVAQPTMGFVNIPLGCTHTSITKRCAVYARIT